MWLQGACQFQNIRSRATISAMFFLLALGSATFLFFGKDLGDNLSTPPKECFERSDGYKRWICLRPYFETITKKLSASAAVDEALKLKVQGAVSDCHLLAHYIGEASLVKHNFNMGEAFASCGSACIQGCQHGVMERYVRYETDLYNVVSKIKNMCDGVGSLESDNPREKNFILRRQCVHGIGHGLLAHGYLPLWDAAKACLDFKEQFSRDVCIGGLTMENMNQYLGLEESYLRKTIPEICTPLGGLNDKAVMKMCIGNLALGLMFYTGHDFIRSEELCEELAQKDAIICKESLQEVVAIRNQVITDIPF